MTLVDMWLNSGSISVKNSVLSTVSVFRDKDNHIVVRDQECLSAGNLTVLRGGNWCERCERIVNKGKVIDCISEWAKRICMVQLVHLSLEQKHSEILEHCQMMRKLFQIFVAANSKLYHSRSVSVVHAKALCTSLWLTRAIP